MEINKSQKMMLQYLKDSKDTGPSLLLMYKLCWKCSLGLIIIVVLVIALDLIYGGSSESLVFYGAISGMIMRDHGIKRKQKMNWPVHKEIINWEKVDSLLVQK